MGCCGEPLVILGAGAAGISAVTGLLQSDWGMFLAGVIGVIAILTGYYFYYKKNPKKN